jgi:hypothetical protein
MAWFVWILFAEGFRFLDLSDDLTVSYDKCWTQGQHSPDLVCGEYVCYTIDLCAQDLKRSFY